MIQYSEGKYVVQYNYLYATDQIPLTHTIIILYLIQREIYLLALNLLALGIMAGEDDMNQ